LEELSRVGSDFPEPITNESHKEVTSPLAPSSQEEEEAIAKKEPVTVRPETTLADETPASIISSEEVQSEKVSTYLPSFLYLGFS
jgi:hypothetical protein